MKEEEEKVQPVKSIPRIRRATSIVFLLAILVVITACNGSDGSPSTSQPTADGSSPSTPDTETTSTVGGSEPSGGTAIIGVGNDPAIVNPNLSTGAPDIFMGCMVYEGLISANMDGTVEPALASSWSSSPDGLEHSFELVEANWHDGEPFTSADVKFTFEKISAEYSAIFGRMADNIVSIETPDERHVVITLDQPYGPFFLSLNCYSGGAILPKHLFEGTDPSTNPASLREPIGTGPFVLSSWSEGEHYTFTKNDDYWLDGAPILDEVIMQVIPNPASRIAALQSGSIHYLPYDLVNFNDYAAIEASPSLQLNEELFPPPNDILFFNVRRDIVSDPSVRHALAMATDREFLLQTIWFDIGNVGVSSFDSRIEWAHNADVNYSELYPYDVAAANALLDEAGYTPDSNGVRFSLDYVAASSQQTFVDAGLALKSMYEEIGVELNVVTVDQTAIIDAVFTGTDFDLTMQGYTTYGDPALGIVRVFISDTINTPYGNASGYSNSAVDELAVQGQVGTSFEERAVPYFEIQEIIAEDLPSLVVHERTAFDAASIQLKDLWTNRIGYGDWSKAWLEE